MGRTLNISCSCCKNTSLKKSKNAIKKNFNLVISKSVLYLDCWINVAETYTLNTAAFASNVFHPISFTTIPVFY